MKIERPYPSVTVTDRCADRLRGGHPWVYDNELFPPDQSLPANGAIADVCTRNGRYLGTGYYNGASKIRLRLISDNPNDRFDEAFFRRRLLYAWDYRKTIYDAAQLQCCRVIFGEADRFPGLTVDRFGNLLSVQLLSLAMEQAKEQLLPLLLELLQADGQTIDGIFLRNDVAVRALEGLPQETGWFWRANASVSPIATICENGIEYTVDVEHGQKTGFFLDQKYNRRAAATLAAGKTVLDCFCHTGSFALNCAKGGAKHVHAVDVSQAAIDRAIAHAAQNGLSDRMTFETADVFDYLRQELQAHSQTYDYIILDPPAFTKSRKTTKNATQGYLEINTLAMRLLPRGGYLATCSCSHFMTAPMFLEMLQLAAKQAGVRLRQIAASQQAPDHPILLSVPETDYLKFFLLQIL